MVGTSMEMTDGPDDHGRRYPVVVRPLLLPEPVTEGAKRREITGAAGPARPVSTRWNRHLPLTGPYLPSSSKQNCHLIAGSCPNDGPRPV